MVAGQGTVGMEVIRQLSTVEAIFVPVGGGGLISGIAAYVKSIRPDVKVGRCRFTPACPNVIRGPPHSA